MHYVPIAYDGNDLDAKLPLIHAMSDGGKHIADACVARADEILTLDYMRRDIIEIKRGWSACII